MAAETRVGIDGRRYVRKQHKMYIDVLHLPSISDAVNQASKMLRAGIVHAMSSSVPEEKREGADPRSRPKSDRNPKQPPTGRGRAKPHDIYSALAEKSQKLSKEKAAARREVLEITPEQDTKEPSNETSGASSKSDEQSAGKPSSRLISRSWNSSIKAGPSILSKRPRASDAVAGSDRSSGSNEDSAFQRVQKRERRDNDIDAEQMSASSKDRQSSDSKHSSEPRRNGKKMGVNSTSAAARIGNERQSLGPSKVIKKPEHARANKVPSMASKVASMANRPYSMASKAGRTSTVGAIPRQTSTMTVVASGMKPKSEAIVASGMKPKFGTVIASGMKPKSIPDRFAAAARKQATLPVVPKLLPGSIGAVSAHRNVGPEIRFVKELKAIGNVPANGYMETPSGKLRPIVTHDPRPKVPHKLRQTTIEKIFEAWRDVKKLPLMEALLKALRTEQTMYAQSATRLDYRAAATVTLKQAKQE